MNLETSKNLGGIGAILLIIGTVGILGYGYVGILALIGIILVLVAMKGLSDNYKEGGIFNNALYGFITTIVGGVVFVATLVVSVLYFMATLPIQDWMNPAEWAELPQRFTDFSAILGLIGSIIVAFVVAFVFIIITAIFYRKSFNILAAKSGVNMFSTAGLVLLIGAVLTIVLVGFIVIWIALILLAVGFFSIKTTTAEPPPTAALSPSS